MCTRSDYHMHSYYSDGVLSPEQLVDRACRLGYRAIALTDHDGIEGSRVARRYARSLPIRVIPGVELSTRDERGNNVHMLGYGFDDEAPLLTAGLARIRRWRAERNAALQRALAALGYPVETAELYEINAGRYIGKPTFAAVLVRQGRAASVDEVFETIYRDPSIHSIEKRCLETREAIDLLHAAGGIAVMAHPMELRRRGEGEDFYARLGALLAELAEAGLDGIECRHPSATASESERLRRYAAGHGLVITGGSDYHSDQGKRHQH